MWLTALATLGLISIQGVTTLFAGWLLLKAAQALWVAERPIFIRELRDSLKGVLWICLSAIAGVLLLGSLVAMYLVLNPGVAVWLAHGLRQILIIRRTWITETDYANSNPLFFPLLGVIIGSILLLVALFRQRVPALETGLASTTHAFQNASGSLPSALKQGT